MAARANVLTGLVLAFAGCTCGLLMCGARWHRPALALFALAAVLNVATVWGTDMYFTGEYGWGGYVVANARFAINPILVACVSVYTLVVLARHTAVGRAVNLASRLESACPPGRVLLSAATWALVADRVAWKAEPREPLTAKGFATPVDVVELDPATADARACAGHTSAVL